jgi:hypothetical protein
MTTLLQDDFSESDGTALHAKALDVGGSWNDVSSGGWEVRSGKANANAANGFSLTPLVADAGQSDVRLTVSATLSSGRMVVLFLRYADVDNCWQLRVDNDDNEVQLYERNGGGYTKRASTSFAPNTGTWALDITCSGTNIDVDIDSGTWTLNYASATFNQTETLFGLGSFQNDVPEYDDFFVESIGSPPAGGNRRRRMLICGAA